MRKTLLAIFALACMCATVAAQAQKATEKDLIGTWAGKWTGGSSGAFEMTVTRDADGKLGGSVSPKPDDGEGYTTPLTSVQFADGKATMKCNDPSGDVEFTIEATPEGSTIKGTYIVRARADGSEVERGTFTGSKKPAKRPV
jgi:hypothetical protein